MYSELVNCIQPVSEVEQSASGRIEIEYDVGIREELSADDFSSELCYFQFSC